MSKYYIKPTEVRKWDPEKFFDFKAHDVSIVKDASKSYSFMSKATSGVNAELLLEAVLGWERLMSAGLDDFEAFCENEFDEEDDEEAVWKECERLIRENIVKVSRKPLTESEIEDVLELVRKKGQGAIDDDFDDLYSVLLRIIYGKIRFRRRYLEVWNTDRTDTDEYDMLVPDDVDRSILLSDSLTDAKNAFCGYGRAYKVYFESAASPEELRQRQSFLEYFPEDEELYIKEKEEYERLLKKWALPIISKKSSSVSVDDIEVLR